jgi:hypothetical protein
LHGSAIGTGVGYLAYQAKLSEEAKHPFNSDEYLKKVLLEENLKSDPLALKKYLSYKAEIKEWLNRKFESRLICKAEDVGSEIRQLFKVSRTTVHDWVKYGKLRKVKVRSRVYFLGNDIQQMLQLEMHERQFDSW